MKNQKGFTLIELLIVVALIAIVAAISVPSMLKQVPRWHVKGTARNIIAKMMYSKLKAIQLNKQYALEFSNNGRTFTVRSSDDDGDTWEDAGSSGTTGGDVTVELDACLPNSRVIFYQSGKIVSKTGAATTCASSGLGDATVTIVTVSDTAGNFTPLEVIVNPFTGHMKVVRGGA
ncbi:MAG: type II secretion system protein [Deltaproteobacteria bacterium]|nr:type II secretion system protein [Deltaproteobacteria bacterium]